MSIITWQFREQVQTMANPGSRSFPAVVIYNVDCEEVGDTDSGQTVIFAREETTSEDASVDEWNSNTASNGKASSNGKSSSGLK